MTSNAIKDAVKKALANVKPGEAADKPAAAAPAGGNEYTAEGAGGMGGPVKVKVTMDGDKIAAVEVVSHKETPGISDPAIKELPAAIVKAQSADVDGVAGATMTSNAIKDAVKKALSGVKSAAQSAPAAQAPATSGVTEHVGEGTGIGGAVKVKVKKEGDKITAVEVVSHSETPGISDPAIKDIPAAIVKAQSADVDGVSGATMTSNAIKDAVKKALAN